MSPYHRTVPTNWWLKKKEYFLFMVREFTSVFIAVYLVLFLLLIYNLSLGQAEYEAYLQTLASPLAVTFHAVAFLAALFHSITWFNLVPNIMVVWVGVKKAPKAIVAGAHFAGWIGASVIIYWIVVLR